MNTQTLSPDTLPDAADLIHLGRQARSKRDYTAAAEAYIRAAELLRTANDPLRLAHTLRHAADILYDAARDTEAAPFYAEALALYRENPATLPIDLANALRGAALLAERQRDIPQATALWTEAQSLYVQLNVEAGITEASTHLQTLPKP